MRIGPKLLIPQLVLLGLLGLLCLSLVIDAARRQESMRATRLQYQAAAGFADQLAQGITDNAFETLSYGFDRRSNRLTRIDSHNAEMDRIFASYLATAIDARERALLMDVVEARKRASDSRNRLITSINSDAATEVRGLIERWQIHFAVLRSHIDDLNVYTLARLRRAMDKDEQDGRQVIYRTIAALLAAILLVVATYFYTQRSLSRPLAALTQRIEDFGRGKVGVPLDPLTFGRDDEIGKLASTFNRMAAQIEDLNLGLEKKVAERTAQLEAANKELEAFSYSASHDLRAPLQTVEGFSRALEEDYADKLDAEARDYLARIRRAAQHMAHLIDDLLTLSRISRVELAHEQVDLSALAQEVFAELRTRDPQREVELDIAPGLMVLGDRRLLRMVLDNLCGNAWKFTSGRDKARIEMGSTPDIERAYYVRDNGAGFDMARSNKLFVPFQRLHNAATFPGTGIGLATARRIVQRHGGRIWAEAEIDKGATFYFTLSAQPAATAIETA